MILFRHFTFSNWHLVYFHQCSDMGVGVITRHVLFPDDVELSSPLVTCDSGRGELEP